MHARLTGASLDDVLVHSVFRPYPKAPSQIVGAESMLVANHYPDATDANFLSLNSYFTSIGGGTAQIQRNIVAERER